MTTISEYENDKFFYFGGLCINIYTLAGPWFSLGIHLSLKPAYVDFHFMWFIISFMEKKRGKWLEEIWTLTNEDSN